jgi:hypothetical protein
MLFSHNPLLPPIARGRANRVGVKPIPAAPTRCLPGASFERPFPTPLCRPTRAPSGSTSLPDRPLPPRHCAFPPGRPLRTRASRPTQSPTSPARAPPLPRCPATCAARSHPIGGRGRRAPHLLWTAASRQAIAPTCLVSKATARAHPMSALSGCSSSLAHWLPHRRPARSRPHRSDTLLFVPPI